MISSLFLLAGCSYLDSEPPAGKTEGYVHTESFNSTQNNNEKTETQVAVVQGNAAPTDEVKTGMAIFRPDPAKLFYLTPTDEELPYTEEELAYWNALALENGLPEYDGLIEFELFVALVELAIEEAAAEAASSEESVSETPVYEVPEYQEPEYEIPSSEVEVPSLPDESVETPAESTPEESVPQDLPAESSDSAVSE